MSRFDKSNTHGFIWNKISPSFIYENNNDRSVTNYLLVYLQNESKDIAKSFSPPPLHVNFAYNCWLFDAPKRPNKMRASNIIHGQGMKKTAYFEQYMSLSIGRSLQVQTTTLSKTMSHISISPCFQLYPNRQLKTVGRHTNLSHEKEEIEQYLNAKNRHGDCSFILSFIWLFLVF